MLKKRLLEDMASSLEYDFLNVARLPGTKRFLPCASQGQLQQRNHIIFIPLIPKLQQLFRRLLKALREAFLKSSMTPTTSNP
jgi:hypothetical protein